MRRFKQLADAVKRNRSAECSPALEQIGSRPRGPGCSSESCRPPSQQITANSEGNDGAGPHRGRSRRPGQHQPSDAFLRRRGNERNHRRHRQERDRGGEGIAAEAVAAAEATNQTVGKLGESSAEIGKVIEVITSIAQQTKPAGPECDHRSGTRLAKAGKGFAVVANEVKNWPTVRQGDRKRSKARSRSFRRTRPSG